MSEVKIIHKFNFRDFFNQNKIYKKYIRTKGQAMVEINETVLLSSNQIKISLNKYTPKKRELILIFKVKNEIYHIPVIVKEFLKNNDYTCKVKKDGQVLCLVERRDYERITINKKIEYYVVENRIQQFYKGIIEDISASGAKLITKHDLDTKHPIILNANSLNFPLDELQGKIVWKERKRDKFFNGIHFEFKTKDEKNKLIEYLY
ncbi:PilZ domain-containing protein [Halanaerobacter jeridensis]|uniref:PilZ domain-containing protein n=1 Tax=Halanaerobacter jeridensis TaxID=706427 RepID=A0A938XVI2_9FIRM|nr:PilZ domain-containing protein [Halanaerobacter jeridensis]MBM7556005.1 hypothetical protein [Halanaerobacter jeridensis]